MRRGSWVHGNDYRGATMSAVMVLLSVGGWLICGTFSGCTPMADGSNGNTNGGGNSNVNGNDNTNGNENTNTNGNGGEALDPSAPPVTVGEWFRPTAQMTWQWQLQPGAEGEINTSYDVDVYDVDLFDVPTSVIGSLQARGRHVICYFSAGSFEGFRVDSGEFLPSELGAALEGFADERWLDIRSTNVHRIMRERLDLAVSRGCDGVEPDNVTGFENDTGFPLTATDQLAFNRFLANAAHERGLSVALKNDLEQIEDLVDYFDFAVNEECFEFEECDVYAAFIAAGKPVFNAEYADDFVNNAAARADLCADARGRNIRTLVLPFDLDDSFRISCDE